MADFNVGDLKTARARFLAADNVTEVPVQGDITWAVTPADAVVFAGGAGPSLTNPITMGVPASGVVISATADKDMNPGVEVPLTIASAPFQILAPQAQGGEVVIE